MNLIDPNPTDLYMSGEFLKRPLMRQAFDDVIRGVKVDICFDRFFDSNPLKGKWLDRLIDRIKQAASKALFFLQIQIPSYRAKVSMVAEVVQPQFDKYTAKKRELDMILYEALSDWDLPS